MTSIAAVHARSPVAGSPEELLKSIVSRPQTLHAYALGLNLKDADAAKFLSSLHLESLSAAQSFLASRIGEADSRVELPAGTEVYADALDLPALRASDGAILKPDSGAAPLSGGSALAGSEVPDTGPAVQDQPAADPAAPLADSGQAVAFQLPTETFSDESLTQPDVSSDAPQDTSSALNTGLPNADPDPMVEASDTDTLMAAAAPTSAFMDAGGFSPNAISPAGYADLAGGLFMLIDPTGNISANGRQKGQGQSTPEPASLLAVAGLVAWSRKRASAANR